MKINDAVVMDGKPRITHDGYLVADARIARVGIQDYMPAEMGREGTKPMRLYRPASEVFSKDTLASMAHRPMTNNHPEGMVDAANWKELAVGYTGDTVSKDGDFIRVPLTLMDAAAVQAFRDGKQELSVGYSTDIDWTAGVTDSGEKYDGVMRNIRGNHVALVDAARAGHEARIGDGGTPGNAAANGGHEHMDTRKVVIDGLTIETTEQGAQALEKLNKQLAAAGAASAKTIAAKDAELAKKDAEIADLKGKVMDAAALDKAVIARADLIAKARKVADVDYAGKDAGAIRKAAVVARLGDAAIKGKSDAYIEARFDVLAEAVKDAKVGAGGVQITDAQALADKAHADYMARIFNGGVAAKEA